MTARQDLAVTVEFDRVANEYLAPIQAAGLRTTLIDVCRNDAATVSEFRRSLVVQLQRAMPRTVPLSVRAEPSPQSSAECLARTAELVKAATFEQAHQSDTLRAVTTKDQVGREQTEFFGRKSSWMNAYKAPALLTKTIGGAPVKLPIIL
ncbi:hypothetical protein R75461_05279 [Paraburkholderia nemoris]|uniref:hypothetical protein n=1 Tax=Paraburkholderia nemoris TaxID=2793076 RepID=UPI0019096976|nr:MULTISPECIES: hypothetical protein [Paraburkholderia]MBK3783938.1 hypothetical protein [Paraburkholderia aspalathi]CAE6803005.1 hypothetical protein R75461_05279 [Paraburkholderia nemoris]